MSENFEYQFQVQIKQDQINTQPSTKQSQSNNKLFNSQRYISKLIFLSIVLMILVFILFTTFRVLPYLNSPNNYIIFKDSLGYMLVSRKQFNNQSNNDCTYFKNFPEKTLSKLNSQVRPAYVSMAYILGSISLIILIFCFVQSYKNRYRWCRIGIKIGQFISNLMMLLASPIFLIQFRDQCIVTECTSIFLGILPQMTYFSLFGTLNFLIVFMHSEKIVNFRHFYYICGINLILFYIFILGSFWIFSLRISPYCITPLLTLKFLLAGYIIKSLHKKQSKDIAIEQQSTLKERQLQRKTINQSQKLILR